MSLIRLISAFTIVVLIALGQVPPGLTVDGGNGKTATLTMEDLVRMPQQTIKTAEHDKPVVFAGVFLSDVLAAVNAPTGEKLRGKLMSLYLLVKAADGYRAVFAMPELDQSFSDRRVYLVTVRDGHPLSEKEGPFRIVVPDEKRPTRWVRQVTALKIRQGN
jgi:hypothetical protein